MLSLLLAAALAQQCGASGNQAELNACAASDYQQADKAMNAQWRVTLAKLRANDRENGDDGFGPPTAELLLKSQRAWLAYRDAECKLASQEARGGSMQPMLQSGCLARLTEARTMALKELIEER
ncbi:lysozyme inhibitor LprI family protein [Sphingomonas sp. Y38-1Y]|uniref:lysozyme inhibitor LprI family protein n=1 Tax=Sphingomonas sp. Y38-1Y TaxID=3078265 RepID=UPI0028E913D1|nr:lysozyme inhibitor LprI family protein [Sphingomonas sp. Y38-1Y]